MTRFGKDFLNVKKAQMSINWISLKSKTFALQNKMKNKPHPEEKQT